MERLRYKVVSALLHVSFLFWMYSCSDEAPVATASASLRATPAVTENVVIVVIDGPRYSETWGASGQVHIPYMATELARQGTFFSNFTNEGPTYTLPGHTAITTGNYQHLDNDGSEAPLKASVFQHYLQQKGLPPFKASIVASKDKLRALADCREIEWRGRFRPAFNCGKDGKNRSDAETLQETIKNLQENRPGLMLVQFLGPDSNGHENNWPGYINAIQETDSLVYQLWNYLQQDKHYKGKTALLITNDHGRHANNHKDGFVSHGDRCQSCQHISLLALGPEFEAGAIITDAYDQADIPVTIGQLLGLSIPVHDGKPITPLLKSRLQ